MPKPTNQIHHHRKHYTYQYRGHQWKIKGSVLAPIDYVSGQAPQREIGAPHQHERDSNNDRNRPCQHK